MQFDEVIAQLAAQLQLPDLVAQPEGACALRLDDVVVVFTHEATAEAIDLRSALGQVRPQGDETLRELLAANRLGDGTAASSLACDAEGQVRLRQRYPLQDLSFPRFMAALERFVNYAEYWQQRLASKTVPALA